MLLWVLDGSSVTRTLLWFLSLWPFLVWILMFHTVTCWVGSSGLEELLPVLHIYICVSCPSSLGAAEQEVRNGEEYLPVCETGSDRFSWQEVTLSALSQRELITHLSNMTEVRVTVNIVWTELCRLLWWRWCDIDVVEEWWLRGGIHHSIHPSIHSCNQLSIHPSIHSLIHPFIHSFNHPTVQPSIHPSINPLIPPAVHSTIHPFEDASQSSSLFKMISYFACWPLLTPDPPELICPFSFRLCSELTRFKV